jgi:hypothetical protein
MSQPSNKKPRLIELSGSTAPEGYHYEGELANRISLQIKFRISVLVFVKFAVIRPLLDHVNALSILQEMF